MNFSNITPLGRADKILKEEMLETETEKSKEYEQAYTKYRGIIAVHTAVRGLFYAGLITSLAANLGLDLNIISKISSYIGLSVLLLIYVLLSYLKTVYREEFYVRRGILINES